MTTLSIPAVLALSLQCAPSIDPAIISGIAQRESRRQPYAIHDNTTGAAYSPSTAAEAVQIATRLIAAGHNPDVGLTQINAKNFNLLGIGLVDAFDVCRNIGAAAKLLSLFSRYNTGSPSKGMVYAASVVTAVHEAKASAPPPPSVATASPPPNPFSRPVRTGRDLVFVQKEVEP